EKKCPEEIGKIVKRFNVLHNLFLGHHGVEAFSVKMHQVNFVISFLFFGFSLIDLSVVKYYD
ncbi:hypothetical protein, partial [Sphingobacterium multivorum]|uniref:hypothetical protein n=1 Tax=Sphingobacterium multivorum TaxID=28454 RepID=UPI003DA518CF